MSANIEKVITLSPVEARAGVNLRLENQVEKKCPACRGEGERVVRLSNTARNTVECEDCEGFGVIDALETIEVEIGQLNGNQEEREFVYEGLGNYSESINTRGDLIVRVNVDRICVEDEDRDFTILSYGDLENFDAKFEKEQEEFRRGNTNGFHHDTDDFKQQKFWAEDFEDDDENDDFVYENEVEKNSGEIYEPLMQMATPELYEKNAFRLLGIPPGISEREAKRTVEKIQKLRRTGISIGNPQALLPLSEVNDEDIDGAVQIIFNAEERFLHEFFWIFPSSLTNENDDEELFEKLQKQDVSKATSLLWKQIYYHPKTIGHIYPAPLPKYKPGNDSNGRILHNLTILEHLQALEIDNALLKNKDETVEGHHLQHHWEMAYLGWKNLFENDSFWSFLEEQRVSQINNPLVRVTTVQQIRINLPRFLLTINAKLAVRYAEKGENELAAEQADLVRDKFADEDLGLEILLEVAQPKKEQIERLQNQFEFEIEKTNENKNILIKEFLGKSEKVINVLKVLLGDDHQSIISWGSKITRVARNAAVEYGNKTQNWRECLSLNSFLLRFPCNSKIEEQVFDDQRKLTDLFVESEIETLCDEAVEACNKDILQTPTIVENFLVGTKNLVKSLELDYAISTDWADPVVRIARSLMIEYTNETGQWQECLALQSKLLELPCGAELKKQLEEDKEHLSKQLHEKEVTDLLDQTIASSKEIFPPAPVIIKDLLVKCQKILDKKSKELGADSDVIRGLKELIYQVANGLLIKYVNEKEDFARTMEVLKMLKPFAVTAEHQKRLVEDIATLQKNEEFHSKTVRCWFCQENKGDEVSNIKVPMYGDVVRNRLFNRTEVTWRNAEVTVPRCLSCDAIHLRKSKFTTKGLVIAGIFGFLINLPLIFIYADYLKTEMFWLTALVIGGFIWLGYDVAREANRATQPKQTNDIKTKYQHPLIVELQQKGWSVGERPTA